MFLYVLLFFLFFTVGLVKPTYLVIVACYGKPLALPLALRERVEAVARLGLTATGEGATRKGLGFVCPLTPPWKLW